MNVSENQLSALVTFGAVTNGHFNIYMLAGNAQREARRQILSEWHGRKLPLSCCGIGAIRHAFTDHFNPAGNCSANVDKALIQLIADTIESRIEFN